MSDLAIRTNSSIALVDADQLASRLQLMIYNGKKLSPDETKALATYATVNDLNPFVGECYYLPGIGPTPGIAGWRKKADEQLEYEARRAACPSARFWCDYVDAEPGETGALQSGDFAVKAILHDTITKMQWEQRILSAMIEFLKNKIPNAQELATQLIGAEPTWSAIGIVRATETFGPDKMPRYERACKRAEKAAIRKRFPRVYLPEPAGFNDVVDGSFIEHTLPPPERSASQNLHDLGYDVAEIESPTGQPDQPESSPQPEPATEQPAHRWTVDELYAAVIEAKTTTDTFSAKGALAKCKTGWDTPEKAVAWMKIYRAWRDTGLKPDEAAQRANAGEIPV